MYLFQEYCLLKYYFSFKLVVYMPFTSGSSADIFIPNCFVLLRKVYNAVCKSKVFGPLHTVLF